MAFPLTPVVYLIGAAVGALNGGPTPGTPIGGSQPTIEQLYKDGGRMVASPILNTVAADNACPNGYEIQRHGTRDDGAKSYLFWTLRCR